ncbi:hypothetical protein [Streptomyces sp. PA03-2a]|uniref:hypothetical protein n=1 Tax=Streptomyces sp. PA03-2a TaxID=3028701 RepID=UPI0029A17E32|nr:hypothetical protein [Streptomyces sp. PA03-2a]MDX2731198.1 hypothetical protein [Streptomyces sp. PA03-2a]
MPENTGPAPSEHRVEDATLQYAYSMFIQHTVACAQCRTEGMDCVAAGELRQEYRAAKERARRSV